MNNLTDIPENFGTLYYPTSALVFYETKGANAESCVEHFDMDKNGTLINAHPLTVREAGRLAKSLKITEEKEPFLKSQGVMKTTILQVDPIHNGVVIWYTKAVKRDLYFTEKLEIPNGKANVPPMLWVANRNQVHVFALSTDRRPTEKTLLYHAPFFNVYDNGAVCMGTVDIRIKKTASLDEFTTAWENYFFNSYFSHLMQDHNPVKGNCVNLWKRLIQTGEGFPKDQLKPSDKTLKALLR